VRRYAANWSKATREASAGAYVPLSSDPGEAYQFDWSQEVVVIDGATMVRALIVDRWVERRGTWRMRPGLQGLTGLYGALVFWFLQAPLATRSHLKLHPETNLHESR
jgi:hypothetical protein